MKRFHTAREAKEFLASQVVQQAARESIPLTEIERKWLYFSEGDMERLEADEDKDEDAQKLYEEKISSLIRHAVKRARREAPEEYVAWWEAIRILGKQDHYINVMIKGSGARPPGDLLKLLGTALVIVAIPLCIAILMAIFHIDSPSREALGFYIWAIATALAIAIALDWFVTGGKTLNALMDTVLFRNRERRD